ncbi:carbon storage regulator, partial [Hyalomma marginatum]
VKLGITFPKGFTVLRKEIFDAVAEENIEALKSFDEYEIEKN